MSLLSEQHGKLSSTHEYGFAEKQSHFELFLINNVYKPIANHLLPNVYICMYIYSIWHQML